MTPLDWMFVGYSAMFGAIVLYVGNLGRRQAVAERDLAALRAALEAEAASAGAEGGGAAAREPVEAARGAPPHGPTTGR